MGLVDVIGKGYVMDNYIAFFKNMQKERMYKVYVTDALKAIATNTSKAYGGVELNKRFIDVLEPHIEKRTANDIINNIKRKLKGLQDGNNSI